MQNKQYFHILSGIRGIAAVLVVIRHIPGLFPSNTFTMSYMAVDIFFLLSGVVIEASYAKRLTENMSVLQFFWVRLVRIWPLYALGTMVVLFAVMISPRHLLNGHGLTVAVPHMAFQTMLAVFLIPNLHGSDEFPFDFPAWSLFFELIVNIVYATIVGKLTNGRLHLLALLCGACLFLSVLKLHYHYGDEMGWDRHTFLAGFFRTGWSFFAGVAIYRFHLKRPLAHFQRHSGYVSVFLVMLIAALLMLSAPKGIGTIYYDLCVFLLFPAIIYGSLSIEPGPAAIPFWKFLGNISYPTYTMHVPLYCLLCSVILDAGLPLPSRLSWQGLCFLAWLMLIAFFLDRLFDRPVQLFLKGSVRKVLMSCRSKNTSL